MHSPREALAAGFLQRVVPPADLLHTAIAEADALGHLPTDSFRQEKETRVAQATDRIQTQLQADLAMIKRIGV